MKNYSGTEKQKNLDRFLNWINRQFPGAKNEILARSGVTLTFPTISTISNHLNALGQDESSAYFVGPPSALAPTPQPTEESWTDVFSKIVDAAKTVVPAYGNYEMQKKNYEIQLERAKAGLPPLDLEQYAPAIRVQHAVDYAALGKEIKPNTESLLWIGAAIIGGLFILGNR